MKNKNTLEASEYISKHFYWTMLLYLLYRNWLFCPVFELSVLWSTVLMLVTVAIGTVAGILLTLRCRRNYLSMACNVILSFGPYFLFSFWNVSRTRVVIGLLAAVLLIAGYLALMVAVYRDQRKTRRRYFPAKRFFFACFLNTRTLAASVLTVILAVTLSGPFLGLAILQDKTEPVGSQPEAKEGATITANMDTVLLLQDEYWQKLDATQRLAVLQTIARIEANYLGIEETEVCSKVLNEMTRGYYSHDTRTITLNLTYLSTADSQTMLETLCHECYHAYQFQLVEVYQRLDPENKDLLLFYEAAQYEKEFQYYIDGLEDFPGYSQQWCEADSREYAAKAAIDYFYRIHQYNEAQKTEEEESHDP